MKIINTKQFEYLCYCTVLILSAKLLFVAILMRMYNKIVGYSQRRHMHIRIESKSKEQGQQGYRSRSHKTGKQSPNQFKGMTLKQYFRLSDNAINGYDQIRETDEEDNCSSKVPTPCFNQYNSRHKIKTQVYEEKPLNEDKVSFIIKEKNKAVFPFENKTKNLRLDNIGVQLPKRQEKKNVKNKRMKTLGSMNKDHLNRSTITSFYQLQEKKKKMLDKVKYEKERANQMKLSDAFFITRYAQKFKLNPKHAY